MKAKTERLKVQGYTKVDLADGGAWHKLDVYDEAEGETVALTVPEPLVEDAKGLKFGDEIEPIISVRPRSKGGSRLRVDEIHPVKAATRQAA